MLLFCLLGSFIVVVSSFCDVGFGTLPDAGPRLHVALFDVFYCLVCLQASQTLSSLNYLKKILVHSGRNPTGGFIQARGF